MRRLAASASPPILSAFICPSLKGRLYVEANSALDVQKGCCGLPGVLLHGILHVAIDQALSLLQLRPHGLTVSPGDWVRMKSGLYRQDLALVVGVSRGGTNVTVATIPRLDLAMIDRGKRKRQQSRPAKRLFDQQEVVRACGAESVTRYNRVFGFRKQLFKNGLLELDVELDDLVQELATPSKSELREFTQSQTVDVQSIERAFTRIIRNSQTSVKPEDRVIVVSGELKGKIGVVKDVQEAVVTLLIGDNPEAKLLTTGVNRHFQLHDYVKVTDGLEIGRCGWVIAINLPDVTFFDKEKSEEVRHLQCHTPHRLLDFCPAGHRLVVGFGL
jgi:transcription elongation factor SPT5